MKLTLVSIALFGAFFSFAQQTNLIESDNLGITLEVPSTWNFEESENSLVFTSGDSKIKIVRNTVPEKYRSQITPEDLVEDFKQECVIIHELKGAKASEVTFGNRLFIKCATESEKNKVLDYTIAIEYTV